jgi:hypothetical protein
MTSVETLARGPRMAGLRFANVRLRPGAVVPKGAAVRVQCAVDRAVIGISRAVEERAVEEMKCESRLCWSKSVDEAGVVS